MTPRLRLLALPLLLAVTCAAAWAQDIATSTPSALSPNAAIRHHPLNLFAGEIQIINTPEIQRVAIGNGKLLGVTTLNTQIVVIGEKPGVTDLYTWSKSGTVRAYHVVISANDNAQTFADLKNLLAQFPGVTVIRTGSQVAITGRASPTELKQLTAALNAYPAVLDLVRPSTIHMKPMVVLDVQVVNFSKNALDNLGINWQQGIVGPALGLIGDFSRNSLYRLGDVGGSQYGGTASNTFNNAAGPLTGLPLGVAPFKGYAGIVTSISSEINLAVTNGQAYILANPKLVTRSGETASFLAGGEVPIPVSSIVGTTVTYKNYGVKLQMTPTADQHGNILVSLKTELSQIDPSLTVNTYPAFLTRKTDSVVNVHSGQTIVLSGLINATGANSVNKVPGLGDLPILGALFRSTQFQHNQSELVIFVTPEEISPNSAQNHALVNQAQHLEDRFNKDFAHGYFVPGVGHDPDSVGYPQFPPSTLRPTQPGTQPHP